MQLPPFFYQIFESLPRQGPGCPAATKKAFSYLPPLPTDAKVLDIGCGKGIQTRDLAGLTTGTITALDNHQPFLDVINAWAGKAGMTSRVKTICGSMDALPFDKRSFDLIWSEGAIFIVGFEEGLESLEAVFEKRRLHGRVRCPLVPAQSPKELMDWWESEGYVPVSEEEMKERVKRTGLRLVATYRLPEAGWWDNYLVPLLARTAEFRKTHGKNPEDAALLNSLEHEAEMCRKYKRYYGYTFFVMQNV